MTLCIHLFGQPRLRLNTQPVKLVAPPKTLPLLAYLLLHHPPTMERQQIAFALWPDEPEAVARANLRRHLHQLQRALPPALTSRPWLLCDTTTLAWNPQADFWLDVAEFERLSAQPAALEEAAACYSGDLLETVYDDWVFFERERLRCLYLDVLSRLVLQQRAQRNYVKATAFAHQCLSRDPFREDVVRQLITLRYEMGDRAGAIQEYHAFEHLVRQELGVAPMPETQALYQLILHSARLPDETNLPPTTVELRSVPPTPPALLPFAGREAEMQQALACWSRAACSRGSLLLIGGQAGMGKTRLAHELSLLVERQHGRILLGRSDPHRPRPYQPLVEALGSALPLIAASGMAPLHLATLATLLPELGRRSRLPRLPALEPEQERIRLFDAVAHCLEKLAGARPLLLILEDLHWVEETTTSLLEFLTRRAARHPILILGTYREEETPRGHPLRALRRRLQTDNLVEHLALGCLSPQAVGSLLNRLTPAHLPPATAPSQLEARLYADSEGHPLFIELLLQQWREAGQVEEGEVTGGVRAAVSQRLEGLPVVARAYAEVAAITGLAFDAEVVREVGGWDELQALDALGTLLDRRLVRDVESRSRFDYVLAHHLIQFTLYAETPAAKRRRRHRRAAEVLEAIYPDQRNERAGELAHHYDLGGDPARAVPYYLLAAQQRQQVYADAEALDALARALTLAQALSPTPLATLFDLLLLRESIYQRRGERAVQLADLQQLERLSTALADPDRVCEVLQRQIAYYRAIDDHPAQKVAIDSLKRQAQAFGSRRLQAEAALAEGNYQKVTNDLSAAIVQIQEALALYQELLDLPGQVACCCLLAQIYVIRRQSAQAETWAQEALALCPDENPTSQLMNTLWSLAANGLMAKDLERCLSYALKLLHAAERASDCKWQAAAHRLMGMAYQRQFRIVEARQHLDAALELYRQIQKPKGCALTLQSLGGLQVSLGCYSLAQQYYQQAFEIQQEMGDLNGSASEAINLAFVAACQQEYAAEGAYARQAVAYARQIQNRFLEALALQNLGEAEREIGDLDAAHQFLNQALALLDDPTLIEERTSVLADLALAQWKAGDLAQALQTSDEILTHYPEVEGTDDNVHSLLWTAAQVLRAAGQQARAREALARAYDTFQECLAAIPDAETGQAFACMIHNRQIAAAYERDEWPDNA